MSDNVNFPLRMPRELRDKFKKVAQKTGTSMNSSICQLIAEHIYKMEQLGLKDIEEPNVIQVTPVKEEETKAFIKKAIKEADEAKELAETKTKKRLRKSPKKKIGGETDGSKKD
ncbi:Arc family DNA-binding protein [Bacillus paranthracis]|uniref:Arc family DNA-binding protein n=1 Tax=Bacillus paranthracis TaxID=2026186 RepID=UPI001879307E|nr:Arc family DNA-binding protein [Bacillus paranthracis]